MRWKAVYVWSSVRGWHDGLLDGMLGGKRWHGFKDCKLDTRVFFGLNGAF